jgi:hypothetical protein
MSVLQTVHPDLTGGIYVYLCSGDMQAFPLATRLDLAEGVFEVRDHGDLIASFAEASVWCCSLSETSPTLG